MWWILGLWIKKGNSLDKESTLNCLVVRKIGLCEKPLFTAELDKSASITAPAVVNFLILIAIIECLLLLTHGLQAQAVSHLYTREGLSGYKAFSKANKS